MGERTKFVRENAKKHGIIGEKMTETERKFYQNSSKSWLSAVRSMETRGKKQLLPSNGNLYHYAGNNPLCYIDPDGRKAYSIKNGDTYRFFSDNSTLFEASEVGYDSIPIPFLGGIVQNAVNKVLGIKEIENNSLQDDIISANSKISDSIGVITGTSSSLGKTNKVFGFLGKNSNKASFLFFSVHLGAILLKGGIIAKDNLIGSLFGSDLYSSSHEGLSELYNIAKNGINELIKNGKLHYENDKTGNIKWMSYNQKSVNKIRDDIRKARQLQD